MPIYEWDIFKRVEDIEAITRELVVKPTKDTSIKQLARDAYGLAMMTTFTTYFWQAERDPARARDIKRSWLELFGESLSENTRKSIDKTFEAVCTLLLKPQKP